MRIIFPRTMIKQPSQGFLSHFLSTQLPDSPFRVNFLFYPPIFTPIIQLSVLVSVSPSIFSVFRHYQNILTTRSKCLASLLFYEIQLSVLSAFSCHAKHLMLQDAHLLLNKNLSYIHTNSSLLCFFICTNSLLFL